MAVVGDPRGFYQALGVGRTASSEEIRVAFRERAKLYHPDTGTPDEARFRELREAYDALRNPARRLQYDADALESERRRDFARRHTSLDAAPEPPAPGWRGLARHTPRRALLAVGGLALALLAALAVAAGGWWLAAGAASRAEARAAGLDGRLQALQAEADELKGRYRAATFASLDAALSGQRQGAVYQGELRFEPGSAEIDAPLAEALRARVGELRRTIGNIPHGSDWRVLVEAQSARAAGPEGVLVQEWELPLLRVATLVDRLVGAAIPVERLAVRFHAGFGNEGGGNEGGEPGPLEDRVELKLLCCMQPGNL